MDLLTKSLKGLRDERGYTIPEQKEHDTVPYDLKLLWVDGCPEKPLIYLEKAGSSKSARAKINKACDAVKNTIAETVNELYGDNPPADVYKIKTVFNGLFKLDAELVGQWLMCSEFNQCYNIKAIVQPDRDGKASKSERALSPAQEKTIKDAIEVLFFKTKAGSGKFSPALVDDACHQVIRIVESLGQHMKGREDEYYNAVWDILPEEGKKVGEVAKEFYAHIAKFILFTYLYTYHNKGYGKIILDVLTVDDRESTLVDDIDAFEADDCLKTLDKFIEILIKRALSELAGDKLTRKDHVADVLRKYLKPEHDRRIIAKMFKLHEQNLSKSARIRKDFRADIKSISNCLDNMELYDIITWENDTTSFFKLGDIVGDQYLNRFALKHGLNKSDSHKQIFKAILLDKGFFNKRVFIEKIEKERDLNLAKLDKYLSVHGKELDNPK